MTRTPSKNFQLTSDNVVSDIEVVVTSYATDKNVQVAMITLPEGIRCASGMPHFVVSSCTAPTVTPFTTAVAVAIVIAVA